MNEPDVLHPAYGDCEVCHGTRTIAVAGPDENGQSRHRRLSGLHFFLP